MKKSKDKPISFFYSLIINERKRIITKSIIITVEVITTCLDNIFSTIKPVIYF